MIITELKNDLSTAKLFKNKILAEGRSYTWLANSIGYSVSHVFKVLNEEDTLTDRMKTKLNKLLETDY